MDEAQKRTSEGIKDTIELCLPTDIHLASQAMSYPVNGEYYRIQNVEYASFLELPKPFDRGAVTLRPYKPYVEKQQVLLSSMLLRSHG